MLMDQHQSCGEEQKIREVHPAVLLSLQVKFLPKDFYNTLLEAQECVLNQTPELMKSFQSTLEKSSEHQKVST